MAVVLNMRTARHAVATAAFIAAGALQPALAANGSVVFQSVADLGDAGQVAQVGWCSSCGGAFRIFDQFTLDSAATIGGFTVSVYEPAPYWPSSVDFSVWTVEDGLPGTQLFSQTLDASDFSTTPLVAATSVLATTDDVTGLSLDSGTYYVSFYNPANLAVNGYFGGGGNLYQQDNMFHAGTSAGFILYAPVPELGTSAMSLLGLGMLGLAARRRRA